MPPVDPRVMYLILRRDLLEQLKWPIGALVSQGAHAATACLWKFRDDPEVLAYMDDIDKMRKITLEVSNEEELLGIVETFTKDSIDHRVWIEDEMPVCIAVKPQRKSKLLKYLRPLRLFS